MTAKLLVELLVGAAWFAALGMVVYFVVKRRKP
jgi:hypothetical protein